MPHEIIDATEGPLVVTALDFDGCIDPASRKIKTKEQYLDSQKPLLAFLDKNETDVILSGSTRMTPYLDKVNTSINGRGASFNVFPWLTTKDRIFDPFLLNDLWATHDDGSPYESGDTIKLVKGLFKQDRWKDAIVSYNERHMLDFNGDKRHLEEPTYHKRICMKDKVNIVYAHLHYLANAYPNKTITYQLVDDEKKYLYALSYFFNAHPELVPSNIKVQFLCKEYMDTVSVPENRYMYVYNKTHINYSGRYLSGSEREADEDGFDTDYDTYGPEDFFYEYDRITEEQQAKCTIQGTGLVDTHFRDTVKLLSSPAFNPPRRNPKTKPPGLPYKKQPKFTEQFFASTLDVTGFIKARETLASEKVAEKLVGDTITAVKAMFFKPAETVASSELLGDSLKKATENHGY